MKNKIPVTILTGYLGSGKTTLLNFILKKNHGKKIAVIENEFGENNIDYEFVIHEKENIYQVTNGCICCNVREDLVKTLYAISEINNNFESIIIETTGVADPSPILHTFKQDSFLDMNYEIDTIICVVDVKNFKRQLERSIEVKKQISSSNLYILSKVDIATPEEISWAKEKIMLLNPTSEIILSDTKNIELDKIFMRGLFKTKIAVPAFFKKKTMSPFNAIKPVTAEHEEGVDSFGLEFEGELDKSMMKLLLDILFEHGADEIYRMKGIIHFKGDSYQTFMQCIHDYIEFVPSDEVPSDKVKLNKIVVIGKHLNKEMIELGFKSCIKK